MIIRALQKLIRPRRSTISRIVADLPKNILCLIFEMALIDQSATIMSWRGQAGPSHLGIGHVIILASHVCQRWRRVTLESSTLWSEIHCHFHRGLIEEMLSRSKNASLFIHIDFYREIKYRHYKVQRLLEQIPRTQELYITLCRSQYIDDLASFNLNVYGPRLKVFQLSVPVSAVEIGYIKFSATELGLQQRPNMQVIHLEGVGVDWENCDLGALRGLKSLTFKAPNFRPRFGFENCLAILDSFPLLENLHLKLIHLKGLDHEVTLPHLRRLTLHTDVVNSDFLLDRLNLPPNVECSLHFLRHEFGGDFCFRWPRHISSASRCHLLQCTIVPDRVEISASVQTTPFSSALTRFGLHVGSYDDLEGRSDWRESDLEAEDRVQDTFRTMNYIVQNSFLKTTPILAISVMDGRVEADLTPLWSQLFVSLPSVQIMQVDLTDGAMASFIDALMSSQFVSSSTRQCLLGLSQLHVKSRLEHKISQKLSEILQFRNRSRLPFIDVKYDPSMNLLNHSEFINTPLAKYFVKETTTSVSAVIEEEGMGVPSRLLVGNEYLLDNANDEFKQLKEDFVRQTTRDSTLIDKENTGMLPRLLVGKEYFFDDAHEASQLPGNPKIVRIAKITVHHCGTVYKLDVDYVLSDARAFRCEHGNPQISKAQMLQGSINLNDSEQLVEIHGMASPDLIWQLQFYILNTVTGVTWHSEPFGDTVALNAWPDLGRFCITGGNFIYFKGSTDSTMLTALSCVNDGRGERPVTVVQYIPNDEGDEEERDASEEEDIDMEDEGDGEGEDVDMEDEEDESAGGGSDIVDDDDDV